MFQLSKKVEYGLIALRHIAAGSRGQIFTAKEIADKYQIPFELLAKVMQKLCKKGFVVSYQGVHGGYILVRDAHEVKVSAIINAIEEKPSVSIIQCESEKPESCIIHTTCTIKDPLVKLQSSINKVFEELSIMEMV
ncbi:MAG: Rrf2 family transcriptional regulator [Ignavibacteriae bacterium]|nr:Rrf2 family transcriptional regulator [Ignavibacteria bacterium]MBI3363302.1 Rrf2 family transcriptional regulator [Ignavibacteriota bacterium]